MDSLARFRGFNEEYKSMETVAIDTGERRQGKTRIVLEKQFRASPFG